MAGIIATYIVAISIFGILATYLFYPLLQLIRPGRAVVHSPHKELPKISVLFAAYNEASILEEKLASILNSDYPHAQLEIIVGSDQSTDETDAIVERFGTQFPFVQLFRTPERSGKSAIMNILASMATGDILVCTDANILFQKSTLKELVAPLSEQDVAAVAGALHYAGAVTNSTSKSESNYLSLENKIRKAESNTYGFCLGMEGGLYAIRKEAWTPIPPNTFMEDFFQTMRIAQSGKRIVFNERAIGLEDVSTSIQEEYKRKIRISIGNFQNLKRFRKVLGTPWKPLGFAFLFHKVLRWLTPVLAIVACIASLWTPYWPITCSVFILLPITQFLWIKVFPPNALAYFCMMNLGLLVGLIKYSKGVRSSVWQPTKRKQYESK